MQISVIYSHEEINALIRADLKTRAANPSHEVYVRYNVCDNCPEAIVFRKDGGHLLLIEDFEKAGP